MNKKVLACALAVSMVMPLATGCHDSSEKKAAVSNEQLGYDPKEAVKDFELGELNDTEKDYTIEMGYFNCDHMVGAIIGEAAGIYDALGLKVNVTKSGETLKGLTSGQVDVGYVGIEGAIRSANQGAPIFMAAGNHVGGSRYLVASNDIKEPKDLEGKTLAINSDINIDPEWLTWCGKLGISAQPSDYNIVSMGSQDAMFALKAGQIDGFTCCDPYASIAEFEGFGHIMGIGWGAASVNSESTDDDWGLCCIYCMSTEFQEKCPELARRLVYAHTKAVEYMYTHPYNASMMFADGFDVDPYVGLRTVYMKTVAEGRTIRWQFSDKNVENYINYYTQYPQIPEEEIPRLDNVQKFLDASILSQTGADDFNDFITAQVDDVFPIGMTFEDWYNKAKEIDGISDADAVDISKTATSYLNKDLKDRVVVE